MKIKEIMFFHIVIAAFMVMIGYICCYLLFENNLIDLNFINNYSTTLFDAQKDSILIIVLRNNILFFSIICIIPIFNSILYLFQFFNIGMYIFQCRSLSLLQQFTILYRHTIFEIVALLISIYISYTLLIMANNYLKDNIEIFSYRKKFKQLAFAYGIVIILTIIGAILEGNVNVLI